MDKTLTASPSIDSTAQRKNSSGSGSSRHLVPSRTSSRGQSSSENLRKTRRSGSASGSIDADGNRIKQSNLEIPASSQHTNDDLPSATTGLSGETIQGSLKSLRLGSKSSKRSLTGKRRAGSTASSNRSQQPPQIMTEKAQPTTPDSGSPRTLTDPPKKKKGFLSFLCCGAPKPGDDDDALPAKPTKTKPERTPLSTGQKPEASTAESSTAESKELNETLGASSHGPTPAHLSEKTPDTTAANSTLPVINLDRTPSGRNKPTPPLPGQTGTLDTSAAGPQIAVEAPTPVSPISKDDEDLIHDQTSSQKNLDEDIEMRDSGPHIPITTDNVRQSEDAEGSGQPLHKDATQVKIDLPPPPPLDQRREQIHLPRQVETATAGQTEHQKWLLPALRPEHKGRKCLVLDLDETLVHSSFKVRLLLRVLPHCTDNCIRFYIRPISRYQLKLKVNITTFMSSNDQVLINL
jgi:RNA polymerase II subunit A small phosphatase-like protein